MTNMNVTCNSRRLFEALSTLALLDDWVLVEATEKSLRLTVMGRGELMSLMRISLPATVTTTGSARVSVAQLSSSIGVKGVKQGSVVLALEGDLLTVEMTGIKATIPAADDKLPMPVPSGHALRATVDSAPLLAALLSVLPAVDPDHPDLDCVKLAVDGVNMTVVATDAHRLSHMEVYLMGPAETPFSAVIPALPLPALINVLESGYYPVALTVTPEWAFIEAGEAGSCLLATRYALRFPDYAPIITAASANTEPAYPSTIITAQSLRALVGVCLGNNSATLSLGGNGITIQSAKTTAWFDTNAAGDPASCTIDPQRLYAMLSAPGKRWRLSIVPFQNYKMIVLAAGDDSRPVHMMIAT